MEGEKLWLKREFLSVMEAGREDG